jgi:hypothetical protein
LRHRDQDNRLTFSCGNRQPAGRCQSRALTPVVVFAGFFLGNYFSRPGVTAGVAAKLIEKDKEMAISLGTGSLGPRQVQGFSLPFAIDGTSPIPLRVFYVFPTHTVPNEGSPPHPPAVTWHVKEDLDWMSYPTFTTFGFGPTWVQREQVVFQPIMHHFIMVFNFSSVTIEFEFLTNSAVL